MATISRLLKIAGLFCRTSSLLQGSVAKETYNFKEPTNRSHPISSGTLRSLDDERPFIVKSVCAALPFRHYIGTLRSLDYIGTLCSLDYIGTLRSLDYIGTLCSLDYIGTLRSLAYIGTLRSLDHIGTLRSLDYIGTLRSLADERPFIVKRTCLYCDAAHTPMCAALPYRHW